MAILTQNSKMRKSSQNGIEVYNFGIPAFQSETGLKTCPNAASCANGCYARSGTYRFKNTVNAYEARLMLTQSDHFVEAMLAEISLKRIQAKAKGNQLLIRIHDSGDFYSEKYALDWCIIMRQCPSVKFYAYTKQISLFNGIKSQLTPNFRLIYSFGGKQDHLIDMANNYHARVFETLEDLLASEYVNGTDDDLVAALGGNYKIGLVYHGAKLYSNTTWSGQAPK